MLEKIIEVYSTEKDVLDFTRPAFDIRFHQGDQIEGRALSDQWNDLELRIVFDIKEQLRPRGKLDASSAKAMSDFQALAQRVKLPAQLKQALEDVQPPEKDLRTFEQMLEWLRIELRRFGLGFRVTSP